MQRLGGAWVLTLALCLGCSTAYMPRPGPRVVTTMRGGNPAFVRDGRSYEGGTFGGGLVEAVRGNPEAEAHARAYRNLNIGGFCATVGGGVSALSGLVLMGAGTLGDSDPADRTSQTVGAAMLVGGLAAYVTGLVLILNAPPHLFDAVNVYNDGLPPESFRLAPKPPAYGPTRASVPAPATAPAASATAPAPAPASTNAAPDLPPPPPRP